MAGGSKGVHAFSKGIRPKVNIIARLEFELAYSEVTRSSTLVTTHPHWYILDFWSSSGKNQKSLTIFVKCSASYLWHLRFSYHKNIKHDII